MSAKKKLTFYKMHSLGNDFMVIDGIGQSLEIKREAIQQWSDRNTGIGFDQLLIIEPPTKAHADFCYRIYNADGSSAQQCGNGTRCVAFLVSYIGLSPKTELIWQSLAGDFQTTFTDASQILTVMTVPQLEEAKIPFDVAQAAMASEEQRASYHIRAQDDDYAITPVSMGNPHAVIFNDDITNINVDVIGASLTNHPAFPEGANIGFCQIIDKSFIRLRVYERGVGETLACGTGACAAVVAARIHGLVDARVKVSLPGGKLRITWPTGDVAVTMTGNACLVYQGEIAMEQ
ncbi:MAG: diaminopimelate epimerase [Gammaproteobacteria bacterium]|nr:diaminopimelate epimerase [Gammaproteobacteria bacterium]